MLEATAAALLPAIITIMLGYLAARHHDFQSKDAPILNRMVMTYALPIALFLATVGTTRAALFADVVLLTHCSSRSSASTQRSFWYVASPSDSRLG